MATTFRRNRPALNIWPGFVDALATLLIVIIFLVMVFAVAQFYLTDLLSGRNEALQRLNAQVNELADLLNLERVANTELRQSISQLSVDLRSAVSERDDMAVQLATLTGRLEQSEDDVAATRAELAKAYESIAADKEKIKLQLSEIAGIEAARRTLERQLAKAEQATSEAEQARSEAAAETEQVRAELEDAFKSIEADKEKIQVRLREIAALAAARDALREELREAVQKAGATAEELVEEREMSAEAAAQLILLNRQIAELRKQIAALNEALDVALAEGEVQRVQIVDMGRRLNIALASKVQELARYRSEFFGRLSEALGDRPDIRIVGDRFIVQSEVLFQSGSAVLEPAGQIEMAKLASTLQEIAAKIPPEINWILQIEGHTDRVPIASARFPSNWELSTTRATSVTKFLMERGLPAEHLSAAGFGEFQPIDERDDEIAYRRNRRIELKLTQR